MKKAETRVRYDNLKADFFEQRINLSYPLRAWLNTNRYYIIDTLVKANYIKGKKIVDLGCGNCNWNNSFLPVHGIDINEGMLRYVYGKGRLVSYEVGDFNKTSLKNQDADIVVASEILEHIEEVDSFLIEVKRILKPTGKFILSVPYDTKLSLFRPLFYLQCFFHGYVLRNDYYRKCCGHIHHFSVQSLCNTLISNGFIIDNIFSKRRLYIFGVARVIIEGK